MDWGALGFSERGGQQSTLWVGSEGAHTPCHYDTYGCNLVAQISGRKRWILFPPSDTPHMYATRVPYEESSVFSEVPVSALYAEKHGSSDDGEGTESKSGALTPDKWPKYKVGAYM